MSADPDLLRRYNYPTFTRDHFEPWMRFHESPPLGQVVDDFVLTELDGSPVRLRQALKEQAYTIVEFGSFT